MVDEQDGVSGWMFLLVPAHPGRPGQRALKQLRARVCVYKFHYFYNSFHNLKYFYKSDSIAGIQCLTYLQSLERNEQIAADR